MLEKYGFTKAAALRKGWRAWEKAGHPVAPKS
jgi:rhodanese-related sulfurtransferase